MQRWVNITRTATENFVSSIDYDSFADAKTAKHSDNHGETVRILTVPESEEYERLLKMKEMLRTVKLIIVDDESPQREALNRALKELKGA